MGFSDRVFLKISYVVPTSFLLVSAVHAQTIQISPSVTSSGQQINSTSPPSPPAGQGYQPRKSKSQKDQWQGYLSSANAPEKYTPKVMFEISKALVDKYGYIGNLWPMYLNRVRVDAQDKIYVKFEKAVVEFDKNGNVITTIEHNGQNALLIDESGNLCLYDMGAEIPSSVWIFDPKGNLIARPELQQKRPRNDRALGFEAGVVYSKEDGEVLYKLPGADEKKIGPFKKLPMSTDPYRNMHGSHKKDGEEHRLPIGLDDGYGFAQLLAADHSESIFALYHTNPEIVHEYEGDRAIADLTPAPTFHVYKFDSECHLLAVFDFIPDDIASDGTVYQWDGTKLVKWEKAQ